MRSIALLVVLGAATALSGCATAQFGKNQTIAAGPPPKIAAARPQDEFACVAHYLVKHRKYTRFGIVDFPDKTDRKNYVGNDAFGAFNTQGASDMLASSFMRLHLPLVEMSLPYRAALGYELTLASRKMLGTGATNNLVNPKTGEKTPIKYIPTITGTVLPADIGIYGAITGTDFLPGHAAGASVGGIGGGYTQNRILVRIDMRAVRFPVGSHIGGRVIAATTVTKQIVQDNASISLARFFGPATAATYVTLDVANGRREPMQYSTGDMLDLATADIAQQIYHIRVCEPHELLARN